MKKVLLFLFLINLSLFAQTYTDEFDKTYTKYTNELYYAIKANNPKAISNAVCWGLNLKTTFFEVCDESPFGNGIEAMPVKLTPLFYAISCKNIEAIDMLLKLGANVERPIDICGYFIILGDEIDSVYMTPLMYAAYCATDEVVSFLIKKGAKVNSKNEEGKTALMYGPSKVLINAGADVNAKDNEGKTALMYAAYNSGKVSVDLLIKNKANVNAKDNDGDTALLYAIRAYTSKGFDLSNPFGDGGAFCTIEEYENDYSADSLELIKLLINNGANVNIKNKNGQTPLSLSEEFPKLTKLLRDNGAYLQ